MTRPFKALLAVFSVGMAMILWRFSTGISAVSALTDGFPWGIWIAFDVVTGTGLACGGYAVAILVYALNQGRYHPLVRPAVLTSALGYTIAGLSMVVDTGHPWSFWRVPVFVRGWNLHSPLLEVALCLMAYVGVLWIELCPTFQESLQASGRPGLARASKKIAGVMERAMVWILALGLLLPTMHQSALGKLMMITAGGLNPLWQTPILPLLFLLSSLFMGYAAIVFETTLASRVFGRSNEIRMPGPLSKVMLLMLCLFLALRAVDLAARGQVGAVFTSRGLSVMLLLEAMVAVLPALLFMSPRVRGDAGLLFRTALLMLLAGGLYRFDVFLIAFNPGPGWSYFPAVPEMLIILALVALEIMAYTVIVKRFPILSGIPPGRLDPAIMSRWTDSHGAWWPPRPASH